MSEPSKKPDLGLLEEDDEFEEFPAEGETILNYHTYSILSRLLIKMISFTIIGGH